LLIGDDYKALAKTIKALNPSLTKLLIVVQTYCTFEKVHFLSSPSITRSKSFLFSFEFFSFKLFAPIRHKLSKPEIGRFLLREENHINERNDFTVNRKANLFFKKSTVNRSAEAVPV